MKFTASLLALIFLVSCGDKEKSSTPAAKEKQNTSGTQKSSPETTPQEGAEKAPEGENPASIPPSPQSPSAAGSQNLPEILNSISGIYTGSADVDYSFYGVYKANADLTINVAHSNERGELLVHISQPGSKEALCTLFSEIQLQILQLGQTKIKKLPPNSSSTYRLKSSEKHSGAVQDAVRVTQFLVHKYDRNKPFPIYMGDFGAKMSQGAPISIYLGESLDDIEQVSTLNKIKNAPEKSFESLRKHCFQP